MRRASEIEVQMARNECSSKNTIGIVEYKAEDDCAKCETCDNCKSIKCLKGVCALKVDTLSSYARCQGIAGVCEKCFSDKNCKSRSCQMGVCFARKLKPDQAGAAASTCYSKRTPCSPAVNVFRRAHVWREYVYARKCSQVMFRCTWLVYGVVISARRASSAQGLLSVVRIDVYQRMSSEAKHPAGAQKKQRNMSNASADRNVMPEYVNLAGVGHVIVQVVFENVEDEKK